MNSFNSLCIQNHDIKRIELEAESDNIDAIAFYKKMGFKHEGIKEAYVKRAGQRALC